VINNALHPKERNRNKKRNENSKRNSEIIIFLGFRIFFIAAFPFYFGEAVFFD
jgi:hypothetical protein